MFRIGNSESLAGIEMDVAAIAGVGMQDDLLRLDTISQNIANVLTPGYKKQVVLESAFQVQMQAASAGAHGTQVLASVTPRPLSGSRIDPAAGLLLYTGAPQDVVVEGNGFFEVATPNGVAYTRQGSLHVDVQGRLVGTQNLPIMGAGGEISLANAPFTIAVNGDVEQGGRVVANLKRVSFDSAGELGALGQGLYAQGGARFADSPREENLRIGFQESSNVISAQEMVKLTETVRHFEALQKIVQGYDDSLEKTIRKLGDF